MSFRVAHIITELALGGAQINTCLNFANHDQDKFESWLIYGAPGDLKTERFPERQVRVDCLRRDISPFFDIMAFFRLWRLFRRLKPQIVHTHSFKAGVLGRLAAFLAGVPVIIHTYHGFSCSPFSSALKKLVFRMLERLLNLFTARLILVSREDLEQGVRQKIFPLRKAVLIYSGFDQRPFLESHERDLQLSRFAIPESSFIIGVIAPFKPQKNLLFLVEVAALVVKKRPEALFFLAGDGFQREKLSEKIARLGLEKNFRLPGFITDIAAAASVFDLGVSVALWEGLPQSLVQLRLLKKALVVSDISGNREVVRDGENGYLCGPFDAGAFAAKIISLIENDFLRRQFAKCKEDLAPWDYRVMVAATDRLYLELLSDKRILDLS